MLSEDIRNLREALKSALDEDRLTRTTMELTIWQLKALAEAAEALEGRAIPPAAQLNDANAPANVVRLAQKLDRAGVTVGVQAGPEGGRP